MKLTTPLFSVSVKNDGYRHIMITYINSARKCMIVKFYTTDVNVHSVVEPLISVGVLGVKIAITEKLVCC